MKLFALLPALLFLFHASFAAAQHPGSSPAADTSAARVSGPTSPLVLEAFLDAFVAERMEALHIPGAVFVMIRDSAVFFQKGYGYADVTSETLVDPNETLFQVASVSKLFTATAVLQGVERGEIDLHADVNEYLSGFQVEATFDEPVTAAHLLTHTGGFDERNIGYAARDVASLRPLGVYLAERMPPRALPPGTVTSYSNHGFGLAGHLVASVSGEPFPSYVEAHLLRPLAMSRSTFETPLPAAFAPYLATGYRWTGTTYEETPLLLRNVAPAGALSTTAADIARFMLAHVQEGRYRNARILDPASIRDMHRQQFTHHPRLPGMAYGFMEQEMNGYRLLTHAGDNPGFGSLLVLLPEEKAGFFVATNALSNTLRQRLVRGFMDRFYPSSTPVHPLQPTAEQRTRVQRFTGAYRLNRYGRRSVENLLTVFQGQFNVGADAEGYLVTQDGNRWVEVEPLLFRHAEEEAYLAFREDAQGRITHLFRSIDLGSVFPGAYERQPWYASGTFVNEFFLSWVPVLLLTWVAWPIGALIGFVRRRWTKRPRPRHPRWVYAARWIAALFGLGTTIFAFGFIQKGVQYVRQGGGELLYGLPDTMATLLWIPLVQAGLVLGIVVFAVLAWRDKVWTVAGRLHYTLFALSALAWIYFVAYYQVLGRVY